MRTGTHYFPRGVSSVVAVEQSRHKFGLNKIDEGTGSETTANSHRRTESCDSNRRSLTNGAGISVDGTVNGHMLAAKTNLQSVIVSTGLSPDLQRRLALQNYKGMECKKWNFVLFFHLNLTVELLQLHHLDKDAEYARIHGSKPLILRASFRMVAIRKELTWTPAQHRRELNQAAMLEQMTRMGKTFAWLGDSIDSDRP